MNNLDFWRKALVNFSITLNTCSCKEYQTTASTLQLFHTDVKIRINTGWQQTPYCYLLCFDNVVGKTNKCIILYSLYNNCNTHWQYFHLSLSYTIGLSVKWKKINPNPQTYIVYSKLYVNIGRFFGQLDCQSDGWLDGWLDGWSKKTLP